MSEQIRHLPGCRDENERLYIIKIHMLLSDMHMICLKKNSRY
jgi:hypothetical protein